MGRRLKDVNRTTFTQNDENGLPKSFCFVYDVRQPGDVCTSAIAPVKLVCEHLI